ncbi:uncharacterized protein MYCFIDRAFT_177353 [Pseudocercospora fijiensis CIRAD86]|uniref:Uncharacterized protein n=1 Tax=Pseudocercospora fijiensis (strain CIRAD86) TaxID=383855 RepID=M3ASC5_PSEFD|nr:uncharacterized protein MYCFIDRAFT_177353 [Pseudocercospora fijiensis CIRAD86]EME80407.1 hypothetical protein MYCFIDRAFT_177353 [Pseudocercospora fijiensis CIRAD86]
MIRRKDDRSAELEQVYDCPSADGDEMRIGICCDLNLRQVLDQSSAVPGQPYRSTTHRTGGVVTNPCSCIPLREEHNSVQRNDESCSDRCHPVIKCVAFPDFCFRVPTVVPGVVLESRFFIRSAAINDYSSSDAVKMCSNQLKHDRQCIGKAFRYFDQYKSRSRDTRLRCVMKQPRCPRWISIERAPRVFNHGCLRPLALPCENQEPNNNGPPLLTGRAANSSVRLLVGSAFRACAVEILERSRNACAIEPRDSISISASCTPDDHEFLTQNFSRWAVGLREDVGRDVGRHSRLRYHSGRAYIYTLIGPIAVAGRLTWSVCPGVRVHHVPDA